MSMFIVPTDAEGLTIAPPEKKMGAGGTHSHEVRYENVRVPQEALLGEEGLGLQQTLHVLDGGRISVGALSVGIAQAALEEAIAYAKERVQYDRPIGAFQALQHIIANMWTTMQTSRYLVYKAVWLESNSLPCEKEASMAKYFTGETITWLTSQAVRIHGGMGYTMDLPVQRYFRDAILHVISDGASEIQQLIIGRKIGL